MLSGLFSVSLKDLFADDFEKFSDRFTIELCNFENSKQMEVYIMVGARLVKIRLDAKCDQYQDTSSFACRVIELDGDAIAPEEQQEKSSMLQSGSDQVTANQQMAVVSETLEKFNVRGRPISIRDEFAAEYMRVVRMRKKMVDRAQEGKRGAECS